MIQCSIDLDDDGSTGGEANEVRKSGVWRSGEVISKQNMAGPGMIGDHCV